MISPGAREKILWASFVSAIRFMLLRLFRNSRIDPTRTTVPSAGVTQYTGNPRMGRETAKNTPCSSLPIYYIPFNYLDWHNIHPIRQTWGKKFPLWESRATERLNPTPGFPDHRRKNEDLSSRSFHASLSLLPSRIERKADTIIASITKKPIPKNAQNRTSSMAAPFPFRKDWNVRPCVAEDQKFLPGIFTVYLPRTGFVKVNERAECGILLESGTSFWNPICTLRRIAESVSGPHPKEATCPDPAGCRTSGPSPNRRSWEPHF